jgi:hypothetical protein
VEGTKIARCASWNVFIVASLQGSGPNMYRAMLMTAGQIASYDQFKQIMLQSGYFKDNTTTHFM